MNGLLKSMQTNDSYTENGMVTNSTSLNKNVDFFFLAGASRNMNYREIVSLFEKAFNEDKLMALKVLFWARDVRGGAGERRIFEIIVKYIAEKYPEYLFASGNFKLIPEFGRWKDILVLLEDERFASKVISFIGEGLKDKDAASLVAKWLPRKGATAARIRKGLNMSPKEYRKTLVSLTNVVETKMANKEYQEIDYSKLPSVAFNKYRKAFERNDTERYNDFLESVKAGDSKINAGAIFPHTLYKQLSNMPYGAARSERDAIVEQWKALPNYMEGNDERILTVCDVSGSMAQTIDNSGTTAMDISIALGLYFSERMEGAFRNSFITFSETPTLEILSGDLHSRMIQLQRSPWGYSTNLESVFKLILTKAKAGKVSPDEMPTKVLIFSDMEFNSCVRNPESGASKMIQDMYESAGYEVPNIVFWNLKGRIGNVPAQADQRNVALLSGFSPATVKAVLGGEVLTPMGAMLNIINSERYSLVSLPR